MKYDEFINIVTNSTLDDWNIISCWGYGSGPSYKSKFEFYEIWDGEKGILKEDSHGMYAIYRPNLAISLAFGLTVNDDFKEDWANSFPDPHASSHIVDLFYSNTLVERITYVVVDGGRANLPIPKSIKELKVSEIEYNIIKLIDSMESGVGNFDEYFNRANLIVD